MSDVQCKQVMDFAVHMSKSGKHQLVKKCSSIKMFESGHLPQWLAAYTTTAGRPSAKIEENEVDHSLVARG